MERCRGLSDAERDGEWAPAGLEMNTEGCVEGVRAAGRENLEDGMEHGAPVTGSK